MADFVISGNNFSWKLTFAGGGGSKADFSKTQVRGMNITETMFEPFYHGSITFVDPVNVIEDSVLSRGDGSEKVTIDFMPSEMSQSEAVKFDFVLNGETNNPALNSRLNAFKTYHLLDANYFKLNQPIPYGERFRGKVGDILEQIFKDKGLPTGEWSSGAHEVDIFPEHILPPTSYRYSDLVKYLMRINYNADGDGYGEGTAVRSLYWDRKGGKYVFKPLNKIFQSPAPIETFVCGEFPDGGSNANNSGSGGPSYVSSMLKASDLTTPMLTYSNEYFMNYLVTGYDPQLGEHGIREIRIEDVKGKWEKEIVSGLGGNLGGAGKAFMPLNKAKKQELFRTFSLPFSLDKSAKLAEAEMIGNMTFFNMELCVRQDGHPARTAGAFVNVSSAAKATDGDAKLCGTWLITKCTHEFIQDSYYNTVNGIKPALGPGSDSGGIQAITEDC